MKNFRCFVVVCLALLASSQVFAQFLSFDKVEYDYGIISSKHPNSNAIFACTNRGSEPIVITRVEPSTSAITCEVTRDTLNANNRSSISVMFNPENYQSLFTEHIKVYTTDKMLPIIILTIKGTVKDIDPAVEKQFPTLFDVVRMSTVNLNLGSIYYPYDVTDTIHVYNPQDTAVTIIFPNIPNHISVQMFPERIQPNSSSLMVITYHSKDKKDWGPIYDKLYVGFQGKKTSYKMKISLSGTITEDFSKLTKKELKKAPKIVLVSDSVYSFDTVRKGDAVECKFHFKNEGKSNLEIRKIKTSCGCTAGSMEKTSYAKGEEGDVDVSLNTRNKHGHVRQMITLITNDPKKTNLKMYIDGVVLEQGE